MTHLVVLVQAMGAEHVDQPVWDRPMDRLLAVARSSARSFARRCAGTPRQGEDLRERGNDVLGEGDHRPRVGGDGASMTVNLLGVLPRQQRRAAQYGPPDRGFP